MIRSLFTDFDQRNHEQKGQAQWYLQLSFGSGLKGLKYLGFRDIVHYFPSNVNVKIMPLKIHGGSNGKGTIANAIKAIKYATIMGADICNMSWGTTIYIKVPTIDIVNITISIIINTISGNFSFIDPNMIV